MSTSRDLLARLVAFDTTSRESNLALIDFVAGYLEGFGVPYELIHNAEGTKANLFATLGPADVPGIVLSGHTDVVPVDGQAWTRPAFELSEEEGRLYGRGTADMKGYLACLLALVPRPAARPCAAHCTWRCPMTRKSAAWACAVCSTSWPNARSSHCCA